MSNINAIFIYKATEYLKDSIISKTIINLILKSPCAVLQDVYYNIPRFKLILPCVYLVK